MSDWRFRYDGLGQPLQAQRTDRTLVWGNLYTEETTTRRQRWCEAMVCQQA
jgi:hypothetical protein